MENDEWIITIADTSVDGVAINRFYGSKKEVKELLLKLLNADRENDAGAFDYGTETVDEIDNNGTELNAYATYFSYHIDYTAILLNDISLIC